MEDLRCHWEPLWERPPHPQVCLKHCSGKEDRSLEPDCNHDHSRKSATQGLVKQATPQEGQWEQRWHMDPCPSSDTRMIRNSPWSSDYSGKKKRKKRERKRISRDPISRFKILKSLEMAQLHLLLSEEMGSREPNLISTLDKEKYILAHLVSYCKNVFPLYLFRLFLI